MRPTALITGARRGIGRAIALGLAQAGFDVALADLAPSDELEAATQAAAGLGVRSAALQGNLADLNSLEPLLDGAQAALGPIDCLVGLLPYTVGQAIKVDGGMLINRY